MTAPPRPQNTVGRKTTPPGDVHPARREMVTVPAADLDELREALRLTLARLDELTANAHPAPAARPVVVPTSTPDPTADLPPLISVERAAAVLGLSRAGAYRLAAAGELPARRLGGRVFIVTAGLRAILDPEGAAA